MPDHTTRTVGVPAVGDILYLHTSDCRDSEPFRITAVTEDEHGYPVAHLQYWDEPSGQYIDAPPLTFYPPRNDGA